MIGRRLPDMNATPHGWLPRFPPDARPGDYWKATYGEDGPVEWWAMLPSGECGVLSEHRVVEHEDGSITVEPSIVGRFPPYHGWLRRGVWS